MLLAGCSSPPPELRTRPTSGRYLERGRSLVNGLAACGFCHGETAAPYAVLRGGRSQYDKYGEVYAANITPSRYGIGDWTTQEIFQVFRSGVNREGERLSPEVHRGFEWLADEDLLAVVAYLKDLPADDNKVPRRNISALDRNTTGFFDAEREVRGYVPAVSPRYQNEYGRYLLQHVARCQSCHDGPPSILSAGAYLVGGRTIRSTKGEKVAPAITNSEVYGIGAWSVSSIVEYLMTGRTPDKRFVDPEFCPVGFYRMADESDLIALARYLKTVSGD